MGMKVFIRSQHTTLPPLIAGPQMSKRIRMKRRKTGKTIMSPNVFHLQVLEYTIIDLELEMEIDGFKMIEKIRELKEEPYKKYKALNDGKCSHSPFISGCSMTK